MGLCKCPKRRVTNQFCFEHRVNVCEFCMVTNHPKCIIQSYLQWLQDSDYNPVCEICTRALGDEECIRFTCYHVFHWTCAESKYRALPRTTAPAGYQCPACATPLFPPPNMVSPVADELREKLSGVNWARAGLGLPLLSEDQDMKGAIGRRSRSPEQFYNGGDQRGAPAGASDDESVNRLPNGSAPHIVQMPDEVFEASMKRSEGQVQASRKGYKPLEHGALSANFDHDENKYKQKSTFAWINRWWKNSLPSSRARRTGGIVKRYWLMALVAVLVLGALWLLSARGADDENPFGAVDDDRRILQKN